MGLNSFIKIHMNHFIDCSLRYGKSSEWVDTSRYSYVEGTPRVSQEGGRMAPLALIRKMQPLGSDSRALFRFIFEASQRLACNKHLNLPIEMCDFLPLHRTAKLWINLTDIRMILLFIVCSNCVGNCVDWASGSIRTFYSEVSTKQLVRASRNSFVNKNLLCVYFWLADLVYQGINVLVFAFCSEVSSLSPSGS